MSNSGDIIGISYTSPVIALPRPCDPKAVRIDIRFDKQLLYTSDKISTPLSFTTRIRIAEKVISQVIPPNAAGPRPDYLAKVRLSDTPDGNIEPAVPQSYVRRYVNLTGFQTMS